MSDETWARDELRALGIPNPSASLIEHWIQANLVDEESLDTGPTLPPTPPQPPSHPATSAETDDFRRKRPRGYSKSNLEPVLREQGTLERPRGSRKPGRPRVIASWFPNVAEAMADGTSLKMALAMTGISLSKSELRACYRNRTLQALYQEARRKFLAEHYGREPALRAKIGRYM